MMTESNLNSDGVSTDSNGSKLALALLLAGGPKLAPLVAEIGHTVLDLSLTPTTTVLERWCDELSTMVSDDHSLETRIVTDSQTPAPTMDVQTNHVTIVHRSEQSRYRGPVGVAMDECQDLAPDALILLAEAGRLAPTGMKAMIRAHIQRQSVITVGVNPDQSPAGVYLLARRSLDLAPTRGFMDLKEQWLPKALDRGLSIHVHTFGEPGALPLRRRELYFRAVRILNDLPDPLESTLDPLIGTDPADRIRRSIVAETATIAPDAVVLDSVVMGHATIGSGAIVARSLICPRGVVAPDQTICDAVLGREGLHFSGLRGKSGPGMRSSVRS